MIRSDATGVPSGAFLERDTVPLAQRRTRPRTVRITVVALSVVAVSVAHYATPSSYLLLHNVYQRLYYLPVLLASAWFGLRGGLVTAIVCGLLYVPHIVLHWSHMRAYQANQILELTLFVLIGFVAGVLSDRERTLRRQAEAVAAERDTALLDLQETVETLTQADRLATLGTLSAVMAHEIRNPLAAMGGALEILENDYEQDHGHREFVDILRQEVDRLTRVAGRYLDYARPQAPDPAPVDLNDAATSAVELLRRSASNASVRVDCRLTPGLPPALADRVQVQQVLVNLLLNAIQAMPDGGSVELRTLVSRGFVHVTVRDHGPGLPVDAGRLFEPFYSTRSDGTGLGLSVTKQIVDAHGGRITAENAEGGGAILTVELPLAEGDLV